LLQARGAFSFFNGEMQSGHDGKEADAEAPKGECEVEFPTLPGDEHCEPDHARQEHRNVLDGNREVVRFGERFLIATSSNAVKKMRCWAQLNQECKRYYLLLIQACNIRGVKGLISRYKETGDEKHRFAFVHMMSTA